MCCTIQYTVDYVVGFDSLVSSLKLFNSNVIQITTLASILIAVFMYHNKAMDSCTISFSLIE